MSTRLRLFLGGLLVVSLVVLAAVHQPAFAQTKAKEANWMHGLEFRVRKAGEPDFNPMTKRWGLEAFKDENNGNLVYISEVGGIHALPNAPARAGEAKKPTWIVGMELKARTADQVDFGPAKAWGIELFKDENTNFPIYFCESGNLSSIATAAPNGPTPEAKKPTWLYDFNLKARKSEETEFKTAKKWGVEVFKDENTGNLVYISEKGNIAAVNLPAPANAKMPKEAAWSHGLVLKARKTGQPDFKDAKKFGIEVYKDENTGALVYITEEGAIAVIKMPAKVDSEKSKEPVWTHDFDLPVRPAGKTDFKDAKKFGVECFRDENAGTTVYISETGSIAVVPGK